jgi:hypothetical protein
MKPVRKNNLNYWPVLLAFFVWGGWALYSNLMSDNFIQALRSGLTQGIFSAGMTFYFSFSVAFILKRVRHLRLWWLLPSLGTLGHTGPTLATSHFLNGTPNILRTISMPLTVALAYCLYLTVNFKKNSIAETKD